MEFCRDVNSHRDVELEIREETAAETRSGIDVALDITSLRVTHADCDASHETQRLVWEGVPFNTAMSEIVSALQDTLGAGARDIAVLDMQNHAPSPTQSIGDTNCSLQAAGMMHA